MNTRFIAFLGALAVVVVGLVVFVGVEPESGASPSTSTFPTIYRPSATEACADLDAGFNTFLARRYREDLNTFSKVVASASQTDDEAVGAAARKLFEMGGIGYQYPDAPMSITVSGLSRIMHGELATACAETDHPIPPFVPTTIND